MNPGERRRPPVLALLLVAVLAALSVEALAPFRLDAPGLRGNGAHLVGRTIVVDGPSKAATKEPPDWLDAVRTGAPFTVSLVVTADRSHQEQVARILTVSRDYERADLMIGQYEADLIVRVRRQGSDLSGEPPLRVSGVFGAPVTRRIDLRRDGTAVTLTVDGEAAGQFDLGQPQLSSWSTDFRLALGDEHRGSRSWSGTISEATVEVAGERWDYLAGELSVPDRFWYVPDRLRSWARPDAAGSGLVLVGHGLLFVPVGLLVAMVVGGRRRRRALTVVAAFDALLVFGKVFVAGRHPSAFDFLVQLAGGAAGVFAYFAATVKFSNVAALPSRP